MTVPDRIPGWRALLGLLLVAFFVWIALEGDLGRDIALAALALVVLAGYAVPRALGGRQLSLGRWLALAAAGGAVFGAALVVMTLLLMVLKTGLHSHGPEYSPAEIAWLWRQLPLWTAVGLLSGLGMGLVTAGLAARREV